MIDLLNAGGLSFMIPLLLLGVAVLLLFARRLRGKGGSRSAILKVGQFAFFLSMLSLVLGLSGAFSAIEQMGGQVAPAMLFGGLKVALIAPTFGLMITCLAYLLDLVADLLPLGSAAASS